MTVVEFHSSILELRVRARGSTLAAVAPAIVSDDGSLVRVDIDHPAYPRLTGRPRPDPTPSPAPTVAERRRSICLKCRHVNDVGLMGAHCRAKGARSSCPRNRVSFPTSLDSACPLGKWSPRKTAAIPVDLVYLWVDSSDTAWRESYRQQFGEEPRGTRHHDAGELRASIASARQFAPWINRTYLVTAGQRPAWLTNADGVTLIDHRDIIPADYLPTFNSHAIEPHLHKIPGLAEQFLYANDDTMFGAAVERSQFFDARGRMLMPFGGDARSGNRDGGYVKCCSNAADALDKLFGKRPWKRGWHHIKPYCRNMMAEVAEKMPADVARVSATKRRSPQDLAWNGVLWPGYALAAGYAVASPRGAIRGGYIGMGTAREAEQMQAATESRPHLLCVNNSSAESAERAAAFLRRYYEVPVPILEKSYVQSA